MTEDTTKKLCRFARWLNRQPRGTMTRVVREAQCSTATMYRVRAGQPLRHVGAAERISAATGGAVTVTDLLRGR